MMEFSPFYLCSDCREEIDENNTTIQSTVIMGPCSVCGSRYGRKSLYKEIERSSLIERGQEIIYSFKSIARAIIDTNPDVMMDDLLIDLPKDRLKAGIKQILHLRFGPSNITCLSIHEEKGKRLSKVTFIKGKHGDQFCPHLYVSRLRHR